MSHSKPVLGVVGLGSMGLGAALSAVRAGVATWGLDVRPEPGERLTQAGGHVAVSLEELAAQCDVVMVVEFGECNPCLVLAIADLTAKGKSPQ